MVDPKVVELKVFNSLPHMFIPVVTEPKKVPAALKWLLGEMEQRYQIFAKANVRNIVGFNTRKKDAKHEAEAQASLQGLEPLGGRTRDPGASPLHRRDHRRARRPDDPRAGGDRDLDRAPGAARARGGHPPDHRDPAPLGERHHRRHQGEPALADRLPGRLAGGLADHPRHQGRGDADRARRHALLAAGTSRLVRAQGAYVGDEEVHDIVEFLKRNGPPQFAQAVQQQIDRASSEEDEDGEAEDGDLGSDEELYSRALDVLKSTRRASTSMLQRRLRIGYNRAARIMEIMEEKGIVGPENGSSPREIIGDLDSL
jgi:DNA segregation ATPase FtsK/SpoIIIE, S-DNA-T family